MAPWLAMGTALWLGLLTSVSPCPLATNIAAISFIGRRVGSTRHVLLSGLLYTVGRTVAYQVLSVILVAGLLAAGWTARFLQQYLNQLLGPLLILLGLVLLGWLGGAVSWSLGGGRLQQRVARGGLLWAALLGVVFALSFCPVSAGLFFGALIPLATSEASPVLLPFLFGVGTAVPVIAFAFLMAFASQYVGKAFNRLTQVEKWVRAITGVAFIVAGLYMCLTHVYGLSILVW